MRYACMTPPIWNEFERNFVVLWWHDALQSTDIKIGLLRSIGYLRITYYSQTKYHSNSFQMVGDGIQNKFSVTSCTHDTRQIDFMLETNHKRRILPIILIVSTPQSPTPQPAYWLWFSQILVKNCEVVLCFDWLILIPSVVTWYNIKVGNKKGILARGEWG